MQTRLIMLPFRTSLFQKLFVFAARLHPKVFGLGALQFDMHTYIPFLQPSDVSSRTVSHAAKRHTEITEHNQPGKQIQHAGWGDSACFCTPGQGIVAGVIPPPLYQASAHDLYSRELTMRVMTNDATLLQACCDHHCVLQRGGVGEPPGLSGSM